MSTISPRAQALNRTIQSVSSTVYHLLSRKGRSIFFPASGIIAQGNEARSCAINATIGTALEEDGSPVRLSAIENRVDLPPDEVFPYAPSAGLAALRDRWLLRLLEKNPSLKGKSISRPLVCQAITHGLSLLGSMFVDPGDTILHPDLFWGNYKLVFGHAVDAALQPYRFFNGKGLDLDAFREELAKGASDTRKTVILNFPNNPTGYTPTEDEARAIKEILIRYAEQGNRLLVILDDAYFGLVYEKGVYKESLFAELADAHENILAAKVDGATKEEYAWGFRVGFITYGIRGGTRELYSALEEKTAGMLRGNISSTSHLSQSLILRALEDDGYPADKQARYDLLYSRYREVRRILAAHPEYGEFFSPLPCNSGYFICLKLKGLEAEPVRRRLIEAYDTGTVALGSLLRIAFSSTPTDRIKALFSNIHAACKETSGA